MIIITGVGRCGTSFLVSWMKHCGLNAGNGNYYEKFNAGNEDRDTLLINDYIISSYNKNENYTSGKHIKNIKKLSRDVVKDPRFLQLPEIVKIWHKERDDLKVVFLSRDSKDIVKSQLSNPTMNCPAFRCSEELIVKHEEEFRNNLVDLGIDFDFFVFPEYLSQFETMWTTLNQWVDFPISKKEAREHWKRMVKKSKIHFK